MPSTRSGVKPTSKATSVGRTTRRTRSTTKAPHSSGRGTRSKKPLTLEFVEDDDEVVEAGSPSPMTLLNSDEDGRLIVPRTPNTKTKARSKKRPTRRAVSDSDENPFIASPTTDSPKKRRTGLTTTIRVPRVNEAGESEGYQSDMDVIDDAGLEDNSLLKVASRATGVTPLKRKIEKLDLKGDTQKIEEVDLKGDAQKIEGVDPKGDTQVGQKPVSTTVYLEDISFKADSRKKAPRVDRMDKCGVFDATQVDPALEGTYEGLAPLPGGMQNISWKKASQSNSSDDLSEVNTNNMGMFRLTESGKALIKTKINYEYMKRLMSCAGHEATNVINPSRIDPKLLGMKKPFSWGSTTYLGYASGTTGALCFSVVILTEDRTRNTRTANSKDGEFQIKELVGILHALEYEQKVATICIANGVTCFQSQIVAQYTTFGTKPPASAGNREKKPIVDSSSSRRPLPNIFGAPSKATVHAAPVPRSNQVASGIYRLGLTAQDDGIRTVPNDFPPFVDDILEYLMVLVAYSTAMYTSSKESRMQYQDLRHRNAKSAAYNLLWAAVLYTPEFDE